ncbi:zinc-finger domain-containing protein [Rhodobacteraceae bacterium RKSG542]|uniref:zinc-finger domain-containing protein n=1 Tax=Pseudovibrio flavus TaxID=2529854 RepID=UPI0012BD8092|nr:zinc-finger domain-containing protein [Pseudovibrio flavus]MTI19352.1 zinc-finger domain-containing protein [Pseudovibrio flavus]
MAHAKTPHFQNSNGYNSISIGAKEFMCIGAKPPFDHPHVFLDMGADDEIICPYCSTLYKYNNELDAGSSEPAGCQWDPQEAL